ncbi:uncharacterized protein LOC108910119 isoform X1 [Anoplophora glabripennis]|uniref:uncharacterized protein LOC108910119 isoform X1 n=1 Tax=Anoplophora glabripennis TaxID=217634 RepID=UPI000874B74D|nr:uncharacterized protein LOC108910119 isoform X1 [Anoplophora glabripennis]
MKFSFGLFLVFVFGAVLTVNAYYRDEEVRRFIADIPEEGRITVLRYSIIRGYELTERKSSGLQVPTVDYKVNPRMMKAIYRYHVKYHTIEHVNYPYPLDIICFPNGCIEIDDPAVHP